MKLRTTLLAFGFTLAAHGAMALTANDVAADLQGQGYTYVEIKVGPTQIKAEAVRGSDKVEIVYDAATGAVLSTETGAASTGDMGQSGVSVRATSSDFVDPGQSGSGGSNGTGHEGTSGSGSDEGDHSGSSSDSHDGSDDSSDGSDDSSDSDHGGSGSGSDSDSGSDHGGSDGSGSDDSDHGGSGGGDNGGNGNDD